MFAPGDEFAVTSGYVDFSSQESQKPLAVTPLADGIPEPDEQFILTLTRLDGNTFVKLLLVKNIFYFIYIVFIIFEL